MLSLGRLRARLQITLGDRARARSEMRAWHGRLRLCATNHAEG